MHASLLALAYFIPVPFISFASTAHAVPHLYKILNSTNIIENETTRVAQLLV